MKNVKFVLAAFLSAFLVSSVIASDVLTDASELKSSENTLREQIVNVISSIPYEGTAVVYVKFSVDAQNGFSLSEVVSTDASLASQVKTVLSKSSLYVPSTLDGSYLVKIKFVENVAVAESKAASTYTLREVIAANLSSVWASEGASANLYFLVKDNSIVVKKVESEDANLVKSISLALENTKIDEAAKYDGYYQTTVKF